MPNMREKIREYIVELDEEINRCVSMAGSIRDTTLRDEYAMRASVLTEVRNDLQSRLEEKI